MYNIGFRYQRSYILLPVGQNFAMIVPWKCWFELVTFAMNHEGILSFGMNIKSPVLCTEETCVWTTFFFLNHTHNQNLCILYLIRICEMPLTTCTMPVYLSCGVKCPGSHPPWDSGLQSYWRGINNSPRGVLMADLMSSGWLDSSTLKVHYIILHLCM